MVKKLNFNDFLTVDYAPGMDPIIKKNAKKRKLDTGGGTNAEYSSTHAPRAEQAEDIGIDEAMNMQQRLKRGIQMKKFQARLKIGRKKAAARVADAPRLGRRARKAARNILAKRMTKGIAKADLTPARKMEIEKRLDKMTSKVDRLAKRMLPKVRKAELSRHRG
jgi:hypothetical protein